MKSLIFFLFSASLLVAQSPRDLDRIVRKLSPQLVEATVAVMLNGGSGSGVIVSPDGLVITAAHVTNKPGDQMKVLLADGRELDATSLGVDHGTDGALLQINAPGPFPHRPYVKTKTYKVGDWAIATGHPGGPVIGRPSPVRLGRISQAGTKSGFDDAITTDATVISGDSGGPLYNLKGEVIGINSNISMQWRINKHVPLPCIVAKWDALLAGETFGRPSQAQQDPADLFDEPYAELRKKFEEALAENSDDPEAAALLKRPRLLDPHHMQRLLDRWDPDPEADKAPRYGFKLEALAARIETIVPDSPAARSDLAVGDVITSINGIPVQSTTALALILKKGGPAALVTNTGKSITLEPDEQFARRHFPQPVAGMIDMIVSEPSDEESDVPANVPATEFLAALDEIKEKFAKSIIPLKTPDGTTIAHGTVIHRIGQLLTKASEIEDEETVIAVVDGVDYPITIMGTDEDTDIALVRISAPNLKEVTIDDWEEREPRVGQLTVTPTRRLLTGVITQPAREAPKLGFEHNHTGDKPSAYLGITFSSESDTPVIETVELESPADRIGLLEGDQIIAFEGTKVEDIDGLIELVSKKSPGEKVTLKVKRGDKKVTLEPILDPRPSTAAGSFSRAAAQRDGRLSSLSKRGGELSERREGFPRALYHDQPLKPSLSGTPLVDLEGRILGINIARAMRHRSLAIPTMTIDEVVARLRAEARP